MNVIPLPHRIDARRGATPADIALVANSVDLIFNLAISALMGQLANLQENLPIGEVKFDDIYAGLIDLRSDTLGRLEKLEDAAE